MGLMPAATAQLTCWDVALTCRGGLPEWVTVRATSVGEAQVAALMLGMHRHRDAQWTAGRVRPTMATLAERARAPSYGVNLGARLEAALRAGRVVPELDVTLDVAWYRMCDG